MSIQGSGEKIYFDIIINGNSYQIIETKEKPTGKHGDKK